MDAATLSLIAKVRAAVASGPPARLVVLFGSRATGKAVAGSDIDIGIVPANAQMSIGEELAFASALSAVTGTEVDLVRLDHAAPLLGREVALSGVCLLEEHPGLRFQTHINENLQEIHEVARLFPWATDYLAVYERYGLVRPGSVMAHNVHTTTSELERLASSRASVAHCPCSNALLGSGLFPLRRHVDSGVHCALGSDVGGGAGFGMLKEALQAYSLQRLMPEGMLLTPAHMLYLATRAGAEALQLEHETGDFTIGKSADFVYLRPPPASVLEGVLQQAESPNRILAALFTLAGAESIAEVHVGGSRIDA